MRALFLFGAQMGDKAKPKEESKELKWKTHAAVVKQEGEDGHKFTFVFSTGEVDRDHDIIEQGGIDLKPFKDNPVVLWAHDYRTPPVARVIDTWFREGKLMGTIEFPPEGTYALSDTLRGLVAGGFLNAVSIGFNSLEWTFDEERHGVDFKRIELYELSLVPVPSNRGALLEATAKGVAVGPVVRWAQEVLDREPGPDTKEIEEELAQAKALASELEERFKEPREPKIELPEGYEIVQTGEVFTVRAKTIAPPPASLPILKRPLNGLERGILKVAIKTAIRDAVAREVRDHTGRLED